VESIYVFTRFKTLNDLSAVAVEGGIVSKYSKYNRYSGTSFCLQVPMSHKDGFGLPGLWDIIRTLLFIFLVQGYTLREFADLSYKHYEYAIHPPVLGCIN